MELPNFIYHPDPLATGSVVKSDVICAVCTQSRGYIYAASPYGEHAPEHVCPWCIADGSAHERFEAGFVDDAEIGPGFTRHWDEVPQPVIEEVAYRTPGIISWQQEVWFTHCRDAAVYLGPVGYDEFKEFGPEASEAIVHHPEHEEDEAFVTELDKEGSPTAYLLRCRHCGAFGGFHDYD